MTNQRRPSPVPKLITSSEKEPQYRNTSGSESDDLETPGRRNRSKSPELGLVIRTSDLTADTLSTALQTRPSGSPSSYRSHSNFTDEDVPRSMAFRLKNQPDYGSSPPWSGALPIPQTQKAQNGGGRSSPRPEPLRLAPDSNGNEIPPDAKWTRIKRSLVSPEVLDQDGRRYEA